MDATDLAYAGIARQAQLIASGEVSSRELVDVLLERIARLEGSLNAFRVVFAERVRMEADQADARRGAGGDRALLGVPIAVKDDIDVAGEVTAWGTNAVDGPAPADAEVVRRLRDAGALIIGKTNVPELTQWPFTESATFGATRNPWDLQRAPGGSSGGSAAAVAAGRVRPPGRHLARHVDVVLDRKRHAEQRAPGARAASSVGLVGFQAHALGEHHAKRVEGAIQAGDALEVDLHQLARGHLSRGDQLGLACNSCKSELGRVHPGAIY